MKVENAIISSKAAIIGLGKISSHIPKLFHGIFESFLLLDKSSVQDLRDITTVFLAVQDQKIQTVYLDVKNKFPENTLYIHFSGALSFDNIIGIHPLMTFSKDSVISNYGEIPLYTDSQWFYQAYKNNFIKLKYISPSLKTQYHAMAVMMGNFTQYYLQLLKINFPESLDFTDFKMLTLHSANAVFNAQSNLALTGPLVRKDEATILNHKNILTKENPKLLEIYKTMEHLYRRELFPNEN